MSACHNCYLSNWEEQRCKLGYPFEVLLCKHQAPKADSAEPQTPQPPEEAAGTEEAKLPSHAQDVPEETRADLVIHACITELKAALEGKSIGKPFDVWGRPIPSSREQKEELYNPGW